MFRDSGWPEAKRELAQYQKSGGRDLSGTYPYCVQVKNSKTANLISAFDEAVESCDTTYFIPIAFVNRDGRWLIVMEADDFLSIAQKS